MAGMAVSSFNTHASPFLVHGIYSRLPFTGPEVFLIGLGGVWWLLGWIWLVCLERPTLIHKSPTSEFPALSENLCYGILCSHSASWSPQPPSLPPGVAQVKVKDGLLQQLPFQLPGFYLWLSQSAGRRERDVPSTVSSDYGLTHFWAGGSHSQNV